MTGEVVKEVIFVEEGRCRICPCQIDKNRSSEAIIIDNGDSRIARSIEEMLVGDLSEISYQRLVEVEHVFHF